MHVLKGRVRDGVIVPDEPSEPEEGQLVEIHMLEDDDDDFELTEAQAAELERRIEFTEQHPDKMIPREQVMAKLRALSPRR
jgi:putative addiction module component (TIGR02574 family)